MSVRTPARTTGRVAAYSLLICFALAVAAVLAGLVLGTAAALLVLALVACAAPLGRALWP